MKGKLSDHPLAELIREISSKSLSGTLRLDYEQARTAVYFERGSVVFAASNIRTLRLRAYLSKNNLVSKKELSSFGQNGSDIALAKALSANGALTQTQADGLLANLVADVLRVALLWTDGNWEYDDRTRLGEDVRINIDVATLMRESAHRMPLQFVGRRFWNQSETLSRAPHMATDQVFLPAESFVLSRLDSPTPLEELIAVSGLRELDALRTIYGLALSGVINGHYWQPAFRETVKTTTTETEEVMPEPVATPTEVSWTLENQDADLQQFLERVEEAADHYGVLDLGPSARLEQIKDAYYTMARSYHPDRFHLKSGTSMHSRLITAFAKVTQAYETLSNQTSRAAYDASLERQRQFAGPVASKPAETAADEQFEERAATPDSDVGQAEYNFREGYGALQQGRINAAVSHLAAAARLEPRDARYRAYYGHALAANERTRRLAENEILAAVKLDPSNALFHTMLAELYFDLKFLKRAQTELSRALQLDPNNTGAILLQRKMDRAKRG